MVQRKCTHPIARYLQSREWEWIPEEQVVNAVRCTPDDIHALVASDGYKPIIECRNGEYRYISNPIARKRACVELLQSVYPEALSGKEIQKRVGLRNNAGWLMARYAGLLPIEVVIEHQKYKGDVKLYRYLPNDPRSLLDHERTERPEIIRIAENKEAALKVLKNCPGVWFSAAEVAVCMGKKTGKEVSQTLRRLADAYPEIHVQKAPASEYNHYIRHYCYSEKPMEVNA